MPPALSAPTLPSRLGFAAFLLLLLTGLAACGLWFWKTGVPQGWAPWHFPTMTPHFADLRTVTSGAESFAQGLDPMVENPTDPWNRVMNYPRVWQLLFLLGIDQSHTTLLGMTFLLLFLAGVILSARRIEPAAAVLLILALFSPAVMLGVERGNNDLAVFFFVALGLFLLPRRSGGALASLLTAFALKLYPLFAFAALLRLPPGRLLRLGGIGAVLAATYLVLIYSDLALMEQGALKGINLSYGVGIFAARMGEKLANPAVEENIKAVALFLLCALAPLSWLLSRRWPGGTAEQPESAALDGFRAGAAIYIGTFLLGHNWDYRLIFLLLAIPQLTEWSLRAGGLRGWSARIGLGTLLLSFWSLQLHAWLVSDQATLDLYYGIDEADSWLLLATLLFLFVDSLPEWLRRPLGLPAPTPGDASPEARMALPVQRGLAVAAILLLAGVHIGHNRPFYNWDLLGYAGVVTSWSKASPEEVHQRTYAEVQQQLPPEIFSPLAERGEHRRACAADAESFRQQLPFYANKPVYPALVWLLQRFGMDSVTAGTRIAQASYLLLALLLTLWLLRHLEPIAAAPIAALLISTPYAVSMALFSSPDGLSTLTLTAALFLMAERINPRAGWALLALATAIRPDNLLLLLALAGWTLWKVPEQRRDAALALGAGIAAWGGIAWLSGNYGWQVWFHHALVQPLSRPAEFTPLLGLWNYLALYLKLLGQLTLTSSFLLFLTLILVAGLGWAKRNDPGGWAGLLAASGLYMIGHWWLFPIEMDRDLVAVYLLALMGVILLACPPKVTPR